MPRVSDEHLAARRAQILEGAADCFAREGFHRTSMADILAASGLSAGAVYRYFRSKEEIVGAIAAEAGTGLRTVVDELRAADRPTDPSTAVLRLVEYVDGQAAAGGTLRIALLVWAEALRDPQLRERVAETYGLLKDGLEDVCRRAQAAGQVPAGVDPAALGRVLFSLVPGYVLRRLVVQDGVTPQSFVADLDELLRVPAGR